MTNDRFLELYCLVNIAYLLINTVTLTSYRKICSYRLSVSVTVRCPVKVGADFTFVSNMSHCGGLFIS